MATAPKSAEAALDSRPLDAAAVVKDLIITAILSLAILGPIVGLKTVAVSGSLELVQRWGLVAVLVAIVVAGRLLHHIYVWNKPVATASKAPAAGSRAEFPVAKYLGPALLLIAVFLPFLAG